MMLQCGSRVEAYAGGECLVFHGKERDLLPMSMGSFSQSECVQ